MEATKAIKLVLGEFYQSDRIPFFLALWRESKNCLFIEPDRTDEKNKGIYWCSNKTSTEVGCNKLKIGNYKESYIICML
ncbi:putative acyl-lipid omega-6 desaturase (cytochrome b5) [Helianthus annuus]|nr:putative acyl-lipid omega-6 desaturase (cytochrome b5) [Helianthus annuus]KAJ0575342.1 putative acyl-lipid omega-6 desaturase (cytochrome b5) [Helianthus annuus]KAJ0583281.1 putative acyl-lipid omega-6 desaturase (cytochrome b5) [Helianthus annuus]KAJ0749020.1 putative acyl-lipid omega-6 desaturase (cytochrome b5) [Helianthus annuus]